MPRASSSWPVSWGIGFPRWGGVLSPPSSAPLRLLLCRPLLLGPTSSQTPAGREGGSQSRLSASWASHPNLAPPLPPAFLWLSLWGGLGCSPVKEWAWGCPLGNACEGGGCAWERGVSGCGMRTPVCERGWGGGGVGCCLSRLIHSFLRLGGCSGTTSAVSPFPVLSCGYSAPSVPCQFSEGAPQVVWRESQKVMAPQEPGR